MWQRLGGLREAVAEGFQEFKRDALRETGLVKVSATPAHADSGSGAPANDKSASKAKLIASDRKDFEEGNRGIQDDEEDGNGEVVHHGSKSSSSPSETVQPDSAREGWVTLDLAGDDDIDASNSSPSEYSHYNQRSSSINGGQRWQLMNTTDSHPSLSFDGMSFPSSSNTHDEDTNRNSSPFLPPKQSESLDAERVVDEQLQASTFTSKNLDDESFATPIVDHSYKNFDPPSSSSEFQPKEIDLDSSKLETNTSASKDASVSDDQVDEDKSNVNSSAAEALGKDEEISRLGNLSSQLQSSLKEILSEKKKWTSQMEALRNKLQYTESQNVKLLDEIDEVNSKLKGLQRKGEEEMSSHDEEVEEYLKQIQSLEKELSEKEKSISTAKKDREAFEQKVITMTKTLEKRMEGLTSELQSRQNRIVNLEEENESMSSAFSELKELMKKAINERDTAIENLSETESLLNECRTALSKAEAEAEASRKEALESSVAVAEATAEIYALREASKANDVGEDEKKKLEEALEAMSISSQAASAELAQMTEKSQKLEQETKVLSHALSLVEAELALSRQRTQEAELQAEEATRLMQKAVGTSEELKEQSDRRAKIFNAAVKAAVTKIQTELEEARDAALERVTVLESENQFHIEEIGKMKSDANELKKEISSLHTKEEDLNDEIVRLKSNIDHCNKERDEAQDQAERTLKQLNAIKEVVDSITVKSAQMQSRISELEEEVSSKENTMADLEREHQYAIDQLNERINAYKRDKESTSEANVRTGEEISILKSKISELEGQLKVSENRALRHTALATAKRAGATLADLGLDAFREERLRFKDRIVDPAAFDVEASVDSRSKSKSKKDTNSSQIGLRRNIFEDQERVPGRVSMRSFILVIYIMILHIMVMVSFTQRSNPSCAEDRRTALQNL